MIKSPGHLAELDLGGTTETVLIRDVQWDHLGKEVLHLDFARVSAEEVIETEVPMEIRGHAAGIAAGGIVEHLVHSLSIKCRAEAIPDSIKVDISDLQVDQGIHVRDLKLPPGVTVDADPDLLLVHVVTRAAAPEPAEAAAEAADPARGHQARAQGKREGRLTRSRADRRGSSRPGRRRGAIRRRAGPDPGRIGSGSPGVGDVESGGRPGQPGHQVSGDAAQRRLRGDRSAGPGRGAAVVLPQVRRPGRRDRDRLPPRPAAQARDVHEPQRPVRRPGAAVLQAGARRSPGRLRRPEPPPRQAPAPARRLRRRTERTRATSSPTSAPTSSPGSASASANAGRPTPPTSCSAGSAAPNGPIIDDALILATQAVAVWVTQGIDAAMNDSTAPAAASGESTSGRSIVDERRVPTGIESMADHASLDHGHH